MEVNNKSYFVDTNSVVRKIWGKSDTILFIFAGAAAEFALNKAVDWLYFTGRLPGDPLGRLFTTVSYARAIVFSEEKTALQAIDAMSTIHANLEEKRGIKIPDWAYRDVLFLLIDYSIRAFEILERKLTNTEKNEVFEAFYNIGNRMGLTQLPQNFSTWERMRQDHLNLNLQYSAYTKDLFKQYRKHLGVVRYCILLEVQKLVAPGVVGKLLRFRRKSLIYPLLLIYKVSRILKTDWIIRSVLLPSSYKKDIQRLDVQ